MAQQWTHPVASTSTLDQAVPAPRRVPDRERRGDARSACSLCKHKKLTCDAGMNSSQMLYYHLSTDLIIAVRPICSACLRAASRGEYDSVPHCVYSDAGTASPVSPPDRPKSQPESIVGSAGTGQAKGWTDIQMEREAKLLGLSDRIDQLEKGVRAVTRPDATSRSNSRSSVSSPASSTSSRGDGVSVPPSETYYRPGVKSIPGMPVLLPHPIGKLPSTTGPSPSILAYRELYNSSWPAALQPSNPYPRAQAAAESSWKVEAALPPVPSTTFQTSPLDTANRFTSLSPYAAYRAPNIHLLRAGSGQSPPTQSPSASNNLTDFGRSSSLAVFESYNMKSPPTLALSAPPQSAGSRAQVRATPSPLGYHPTARDLQSQLELQRHNHQRVLEDPAVAEADRISTYSTSLPHYPLPPQLPSEYEYSATASRHTSNPPFANSSASHSQVLVDEDVANLTELANSYEDLQQQYYAVGPGGGAGNSVENQPFQPPVMSNNTQLSFEGGVERGWSGAENSESSMSKKRKLNDESGVAMPNPHAVPGGISRAIGFSL